MFTGIIRGVLTIVETIPNGGMLSYAIAFSSELLHQLVIGASVSVDGVCQTVTKIVGNLVWFDAIEETLRRTTISEYSNGRHVNIERAAKFGDEIGGHLLSGHVFGTAIIEELKENSGSIIVWIRCPTEWMKYFFSKGYIAIDGVSLTIVDVTPEGLISVHLIPETIKKTTFSTKIVGDKVNIELDSQTQTIVDTIHRLEIKKKITPTQP